MRSEEWWCGAKNYEAPRSINRAIWEYRFPRIVILSAAEESLLQRISGDRDISFCMKHRIPCSCKDRFPFPLLFTPSAYRKRKRFFDSVPNCSGYQHLTYDVFLRSE